MSHAAKRTRKCPPYKAITEGLRIELAQMTAERDLFRNRLLAEQGYSNALAETLKKHSPQS